VIPSIPDQASSIRCHCIFFLPILLKVDVACIIACSAYAPQSCLVIFSVHNLSKNDFLAPPFPKASAKVQPFSDSARTLPIIFQENVKFLENQEKMSAF
jgi:hypothetical protein